MAEGGKPSRLEIIDLGGGIDEYGSPCAGVPLAPCDVYPKKLRCLCICPPMFDKMLDLTLSLDYLPMNETAAAVFDRSKEQGMWSFAGESAFADHWGHGGSFCSAKGRCGKMALGKNVSKTSNIFCVVGQLCSISRNRTCRDKSTDSLGGFLQNGQLSRIVTGRGFPVAQGLMRLCGGEWRYVDGLPCDRVLKDDWLWTLAVDSRCAVGIKLELEHMEGALGEFQFSSSGK